MVVREQVCSCSHQGQEAPVLCCCVRLLVCPRQQRILCQDVGVVQLLEHLWQQYSALLISPKISTAQCGQHNTIRLSRLVQLYDIGYVNASTSGLQCWKLQQAHLSEDAGKGCALVGGELALLPAELLKCQNDLYLQHASLHNITATPANT
jgi:hypothetical protein